MIKKEEIRMKVLLFLPYDFDKDLGGGYKKLLLNWLERTKHDVDVYVLPSVSAFEIKNKRVNVKKVHFRGLTRIISKFKGPLFCVASFFFKFLPVENYDVTLFISQGFAELPAFRNVGHKMILYSDTPLKSFSTLRIVKWSLRNRKMNFTKRINLWLIRIVYNFFEKLAWAKFDKVIFNAHNVERRALNKKLLKKRTKLSVIYPAVELNKTKLREEDNNYFVYISRFDVYKRQTAVLKAWKKFVKKYPQYKLSLVGITKGVEGKDYLNQIKELAKSTSNVNLIEDASKEEVEKIYSKATAGLFVSFEEDFGIAPFEVVAHNKPLIAVDNGGFTEILRDFDAVTWVKDSVDEGEFAENIYKSMLSFMSHLEEQKRKAKKGREFIKSRKLTWDEFTRKLDKEIKN